MSERRAEVWRSGAVTLWRGDSRKILPTLRGVDAIITDPPYGVRYIHHGNQGNSANLCAVAKVNRRPIIGDDKPFDPAFILKFAGRRMMSVTDVYALLPVALCGADHFAAQLAARGTWICWDKSCGQGSAANFHDAEFIWINRRCPRNIFRHFWMGCTRAGMDNQSRCTRLHPAQKPVELMRYLLEACRVGIAKTVCDPFMGTGTTGIACLQTGRKFIGIEIDPHYFRIAKRRIARAQREMGLMT